MPSLRQARWAEQSWYATPSPLRSLRGNLEQRLRMPTLPNAPGLDWAIGRHLSRLWEGGAQDECSKDFELKQCTKARSTPPVPAPTLALARSTGEGVEGRTKAAASGIKDVKSNDGCPG